MSLATGIVSAWLAGGQSGSGSTLVDVTGNGNDGTIQSGINWYTSSVGYGLDWAGSGNIVDFGATPINFGRGMTIFVRFRSLASGGSANATIATYETGYNNGFGGFRIENGVKPQFVDFLGGYITSDVALGDDVDTDIAITIDGSGAGRVFLDGVNVSASTSGAILVSDYILKNFGFDFFGLYHLKGKIVNPAIWSRVLMDAEIAQMTSDPYALYNAILGVASLSGDTGGIVLDDLFDDYMDASFTGTKGGIVMGNEFLTLGADVDVALSGLTGRVILGQSYQVDYDTATLSGTTGGLVLGQRLDAGVKYTSTAIVLGDTFNPSTLQTAFLGNAGRLRLGDRWVNRGGGLRRGYRR